MRLIAQCTARLHSEVGLFEVTISSPVTVVSKNDYGLLLGCKKVALGYALPLEAVRRTRRSRFQLRGP